ncbi:MAG TPA: response regulator, partial [Gemmatimonadales bacterium]|nr:response regulator [Gemmatimonadales bacterium]
MADDEPIGRQRLIRLLQAEPDTEVVAACADGEEAVEAIREHLPDVVLLDIQMPQLDGFEVVAALGEAQQPSVIFVTAHDQYALRAFEARAFDYLLKPVEADRLRLAMDRATSTQQRSAQGNVTRRILTLLEEINAR